MQNLLSVANITSYTLRVPMLDSNMTEGFTISWALPMIGSYLLVILYNKTVTTKCAIEECFIVKAGSFPVDNLSGFI